MSAKSTLGAGQARLHERFPDPMSFGRHKDDDAATSRLLPATLTPPAADAAGDVVDDVGSAVLLWLSSSSSPPSPAAEQQWLLVLRLVRRGVYDMLAKDYTDDVKHIRYIIGLASPDARQQLTERTLLAMTAEKQEHFVNTLERVADNLAVARNARDTEIREKVVEVQEYVRSYQATVDGGGQGEFARM